MRTNGEDTTRPQRAAQKSNSLLRCVRLPVCVIGLEVLRGPSIVSVVEDQHLRARDHEQRSDVWPRRDTGHEESDARNVSI